MREFRGGARPRRGRGGGVRRKTNERPKKTAEDLDAEMEVSPNASEDVTLG